MKRIGAMAAVALLALLLALPVGAAMAQDGGPTSGNRPPATLFGMVTADGLPVPEGTTITAMVGDEKIGSTMTMPGGSFGPLGTDAALRRRHDGYLHGRRPDVVLHLRLDERWSGQRDDYRELG